MPTATPYYGSAAGNGFPFCLNRLDVDAETEGGNIYQHWTTLGGYNKKAADASTAATAAQISLSFQNAWRIFWMFYSATASYDSTPYTVDVTAEENELPADRVCPDSNGDYGVSLALPGSFDPILFDAFATGSSIVRMYNGGEFIGYGVNGLLFSENYQPEGDMVLIAASIPGFETVTASANNAYTTISGIPILCQALSLSFPGEATPDPSNLSISTTVDGGHTLSLDSIEFYNQ